MNEVPLERPKGLPSPTSTSNEAAVVAWAAELPVRLMAEGATWRSWTLGEEHDKESKPED